MAPGKRYAIECMGWVLFIFGHVLNPVNSQAITHECGRINIPKGLTIEGNQTIKGYWPFSVIVCKTPDFRPFCGGTLITNRHVLTGQ